MKLSLTLVSLGLCAAPALAQSIGSMYLVSTEEDWTETPESLQCIPNTLPQNSLKSVDVKGEAPGIECFLYTDSEHCEGEVIRLEEGETKFSTEVYAGSFLCWNPQHPQV